ncbi:transposase family protein [Streptomyces sp. NPDC057900]|uniref:transposase family protein n=1 Tax=Streptomyces sp. NPDC057900 TaxID=3346274 RepID=UPI0036E2AA28
METQVRRPRADRLGRRAFVSGKRRQNTVKTTTISNGQGHTLWSGATRPGRMHDQTAMRTEGIAEQFHQRPGVKAEVDDGYRGLANESPNRSRPRRGRRKATMLCQAGGWWFPDRGCPCSRWRGSCGDKAAVYPSGRTARPPGSEEHPCQIVR